MPTCTGHSKKNYVTTINWGENKILLTMTFSKVFLFILRIKHDE